MYSKHESTHKIFMAYVAQGQIYPTFTVLHLLTSDEAIYTTHIILNPAHFASAAYDSKTNNSAFSIKNTIKKSDIKKSMKSSHRWRLAELYDNSSHDR